MNLLIESLNTWGPPAAALAWRLLWQSSLLIGLALILDWVWGRKLRPGLQYLLWLVVLLKLVLPPTLALPSSVAWWVRARDARSDHSAPVMVTYGPASSVTPKPGLIIHPASSVSALSMSGGLLAVAALGSLGLLAAMSWSWRQVARQTSPARCGAVREELREMVEAARQIAGLRRRVELRLVPGRMSPALFGLFRPVVLMPESLVQRLSADRLRAVLLHELIHLRRGDVWVNCAQALLQIVYWWHPLAWVANHRIRLVREEAVDEAVMLALRGECASYAPTLLEVARLALPRLRISLGLVGILESHRALRQRIERLIDFHPPRSSNLGLASVCCAVLFGATALPMGQAPAANADRPTHGTNDSPALYTRMIKADPNTFKEALLSATGKPRDGAKWDTMQTLREFLADLHVDLSPPKSIFWNDREGALLIRATLQDLDLIENAIYVLNAAPPQLVLKAKFIELPEPEEAAFWAQHGDATVSAARVRTVQFNPREADQLLERWKSIPGAAVLALSSITTLSGRQASIAVQEMKMLVTYTNAPSGRWVTNEVPVGPVLDVLPTVSTDALRWDLAITAKLNEFLGYDEPGFVPQQGVPTAPGPVPHFRTVQLPVTATVWDGQTVVIGGGRRTPDKPDAARKSLVVMVSPTAIDRAGNRVNNDQAVEAARAGAK